jgi:hypothetical protein
MIGLVSIRYGQRSSAVPAWTAEALLALFAFLLVGYLVVYSFAALELDPDE